MFSPGGAGIALMHLPDLESRWRLTPQWSYFASNEAKRTPSPDREEAMTFRLVPATLRILIGQFMLHFRDGSSQVCSQRWDTLFNYLGMMSASDLSESGWYGICQNDTKR